MHSAQEMRASSGAHARSHGRAIRAIPTGMQMMFTLKVRNCSSNTLGKCCKCSSNKSESSTKAGFIELMLNRYRRIESPPLTQIGISEDFHVTIDRCKGQKFNEKFPPGVSANKQFESKSTMALHTACVISHSCGRALLINGQ